MEKKSEKFVSRRYGKGRIDKVPRPPRSTKRREKRTQKNPRHEMDGSFVSTRSKQVCWLSRVVTGPLSSQTMLVRLLVYKKAQNGTRDARQIPKIIFSNTYHFGVVWTHQRASKATKIEELAIMVNDELLVQAGDPLFFLSISFCYGRRAGRVHLRACENM